MKARPGNLLRLALWIFAGLALLPVRPDAVTDQLDSNNKFYEMFTGATYDKGRLDAFTWDFSMIWINEVPQSNRDLEYEDDGFECELKPGDVLESLAAGNHDEFLRYRLDRLTPSRADFTRWKYSSIKARRDCDSWSYRPGALKVTDTFTLDLTQPNGLLIDYGMNYVISGGGKTARSK